MQQILNFLEAEEPNYGEASKLGASALPLLNTIVAMGDPLLASKAAYLSSLIDDDSTLMVLKNAAKSPHPVVRIGSCCWCPKYWYI